MNKGIAEVSSIEQRASSARRVMIIEDNVDSRDVLQLFLEISGHRVDVAEDGVEGVARVIATCPEIVLVDIGLPGLDGYAVARAIRAALGSAIFLAALTGHGRPGDRARAERAGFDAHLTKPVTFEAVELLLAGRPPSPS